MSETKSYLEILVESQIEFLETGDGSFTADSIQGLSGEITRQEAKTTEMKARLAILIAKRDELKAALGGIRAARGGK